MSDQVRLDELDELAAGTFEGYLVRKDLAQQFRGQYPVPTYVGEFLLGRYCATTDPDEIEEGLEIVRTSMANRTVRPGQEELFKSRAREKGAVKVIDLLRAKLDASANRDMYVAELPSLQLSGIVIDDQLVLENERSLTGGFYAEVTLEYIPAMAGEAGTPFRISDVRPIQMSTRDALETLARGRSSFTLEQWRWLMLRSVGFAPEQFTEREQDVLLLRMVPFVVQNYNAVELGPRGTGKSHLYQQVSPYAHLVSGGKASVANMFVNNATGQRGLVAQYDAICFDEISGVSFDDKSGVNILKGYMESGEFSRGKESIKATGGIVMVGNFDVDVWEQLRQGHLLAPLPKEMRDDTAFHDRIHAFIPGWDVPKLAPTYFTSHFGFVSDFLAQCWTSMRHVSRWDAVHHRIDWGPEMSGRDRRAAQNTVNGLLKLLHPDPEQQVPTEFLDWACRLAVEVRRRVKEQQAFIGTAEFGRVDLSYAVDGGVLTTVFCDESVKYRAQAREGQEEYDGGDPTTVETELPAPAPEELTASVEPREYAPGDTVDGRFEVEAVLGSGGFSTVYRVRDVVEDAERALKVFKSAGGYDAVRREISALRKVRHENIVEVIWAGRTDAGEWYLITEYVDGEPLEDYTTGGRTMRDREAVDVAIDILDALVAIHPDARRLDELEAKKRGDDFSMDDLHEMQELEENGLVHRDVKPQNVILTRRGAKLLDFNIATRAGDPVMTMSGTPPYMPPDAAATRWDVSVDLFAVGVILYELLCNGQHPYVGGNPMLNTDVTPATDHRPDLPAKLSAFLFSACANYREDRYATAREMRDELRDIRDAI